MENLNIGTKLTNSDKQHCQKLVFIHPVFRNLSGQEREQLLALFTKKVFAAQTWITRQGEIVDAIYFIVKGKAEVRKEQPVALLREGDNIGLGEAGLFSSTGVRTADVVALSSVTTFCISLQKFDDFLKAYPAMSRTIKEEVSIFLRMKFIKKVTPFAKLPLARLYQFCQKIEEYQVTTGTVLFKQGEEGKECYLVKSGRITVSISLPNGDTKILASLGPSQIFGETALLLDIPRNATTTVAENAELLVINKALFLEIMQKEEDAARAITLLHQRRSRPMHRDNIEVFRSTADDGEEIITLKQLETQEYFQLSPAGWFIWQLADGSRDFKEIIKAFYKKFHILSARAVVGLIADLQESGFLSLAMKSERLTEKRLPFWIQFFIYLRKFAQMQYTFTHVDGWITKTYDKFFWIFYTKTAQIIIALLTLGGVWAFMAHYANAVTLLNDSPHKWSVLLTSSYAVLGTFILHELAHAYTTKAFGRAVNSFGLGWFWLGPTASCDTSDMWLCPNRRARIAVDLAGIYLNIFVGSIAALCMFLPISAYGFVFLWLFAFFNYMAAFGNLSPLIELDGYYTLMDILNKPNLRETAVFFLFTVDRPFSLTALRKHKEAVVYWVVCLLYLLAEAILPYLMLMYVFHGFLKSYSPWVGIAASLATIFFSSLGIFAEFRKKNLSRFVPREK